MSIQALGWAFRQNVQPSAAKFVLVALANYADEDGRCYPSQKTLARMTCQSERSVREHLASLESTNLIARDHRRDAGGVFHSDVFQLNLESNRPAANLAAGESRQRQISPSADSSVSPAADFAAYTKEEDTKEREEIPRTRESSALTSPYNLSAIRQSRGDTAVPDEAKPIAVAGKEEDPSVGSPRAAEYIPNWLRAWYAIYPERRRIPIKKALTLFRAIESDPDAMLPPPDEQVTILRAYCATEQWQKNAGQYVPSMRRYITERMWEHDPDPMSQWKRDGHIYPVYVRGKGLTWPPGYKPPEGATQMSRVLNEAGEWINNPMLV